MSNKKNNLREISLHIINSVLEDGRLSHIVIKEELDRFGNSDEDNLDKSFISRLSLGTIEKKITLDYIIDCYSKTKTGKMKPFIRGLLRMSVYQILFMDSIPDSAACNEAVKIVKTHRFTNLAPFVNGVLRTVAREKHNIRYPDGNIQHEQMKVTASLDGITESKGRLIGINSEDNKLKTLEVKYSIPEWILSMFMDEIGREETLNMLKATEIERQGITLRINTGKLSKEEVINLLKKDNVRLENINIADNMVRISRFGSVNELTAFKEGYVTVQDISSALVGQISGVKRGDICMDLCAAPGGKTIHIADLLGGSGKVIARDLTENKIRYIEENIERCGIKNVETQVFDGTIPDERYFETADIVIVDAPCSGLGVIGHKADIKYRLKPQDVEGLSKISRKILQCGVQYLKSGGTLIFSTCTMTKAENDDNRRWLLNHFSVKPSDITEYLSDPLLDIGSNRRTAKEGYLKLYISEEYDGFFISKFIKE